MASRYTVIADSNLGEEPRDPSARTLKSDSPPDEETSSAIARGGVFEASRAVGTRPRAAIPHRLRPVAGASGHSVLKPQPELYGDRHQLVREACNYLFQSPLQGAVWEEGVGCFHILPCRHTIMSL